jgi:MT-A70
MAGTERDFEMSDGQMRKKQINSPAFLEQYYATSIYTPAGGANLYLSHDEAVQYNADPDLFAAKYLGFNSVDEYREWIKLSGMALCSERTRSGRLCRLNVSGGSLSPAEWLERHRSEPCLFMAEYPRVSATCIGLTAAGWPDGAYELIEQMYPELPKIELFARQARPGWEAWGNEITRAAAE